MKVPDYILSNANDYIKEKASLELHKAFLSSFIVPDLFEDCFFTSSLPSNCPGINKIDDDCYELFNKVSRFGTRFYKANDLWLGIRFYRSVLQ